MRDMCIAVMHTLSQQLPTIPQNSIETQTLDTMCRSLSPFRSYAQNTLQEDAMDR
jgi:hypothetical protein